MKKVHLIVVGKLKDKNITELENNYLKRIQSIDFKVHELKANAENAEQECQNILAKLNDLKKNKSLVVIALDEKGKQYTSQDFSQKIFNKLADNVDLAFIIGGAEGLTTHFKDQVNEVMALAKSTLPHKLARLFFIEQLYRAITINEGHPYHN